MRPNILLITVDDMNYNSLGVYGCSTDNISPNIDQLAKEGMQFMHSHVTVAVCQPSREVLMTGRYPHRNGAPGFDPIDESVPTLQEQLKKVNYFNGIIGKVTHLEPQHKFCWDYATQVLNPENGYGREPEKYYHYTKDFLNRAKDANSPFFLMANSHDPHRPFAGSKQEYDKYGFNTVVSRTYSPEEVEVPGFLPDIPEVRKEIAEYYTSVHRCDESVGLILRALKESGEEENTIVMFLSDNGMAFPYAKTNCYLNSTRTPWIVKWPDKIQPGRVESEHMISGIDYMPTILDILQLPQVEEMDGKSFLPVLLGEKQEGRDQVFTVFNTTAARRTYPMRCLRGKKYGYIYNNWVDGERMFINESKMGLTYNAMKEASESNEAIADRVQFFDYRIKEEFYDFEKDPDGLNNLIEDEKYQEDINKMKKDLLKVMIRTDDPVLDSFIDVM